MTLNEVMDRAYETAQKRALNEELKSMSNNMFLKECAGKVVEATVESEEFLQRLVVAVNNPEDKIAADILETYRKYFAVALASVINCVLVLMKSNAIEPTEALEECLKKNGGKV